MKTNQDFVQAMLSSVWPSWRITGRLGAGTYGSVYEIVRDDLGSVYKCALKVLHMDIDETFCDFSSPLSSSNGTGSSSVSAEGQKVLDDFVRTVSNEIDLMMRVKGAPNIVLIEDYAVLREPDNCTILIRMEELESVDKYRRRTGSLQRHEVIRLGLDICTALDSCEKNHILHRDIKPSNIFYSDKAGYKLGDFGISRMMSAIHEKMSMTGAGTIQYMAPEIYFGQKYNNTVDIYSLGIVLYTYMNDNFPPLYRELFPEAMSREEIPSTDAPTLHVANMKRLNGAALPPPVFADDTLATVILTACAHDPSRRFQSAAALRNALLDCLNAPAERRKGTLRVSGNYPLPTPPVPPVPPVPPASPFTERKKTERHSLPVTAIAAAVVVILLAAGLLTFFLSDFFTGRKGDDSTTIAGTTETEDSGDNSTAGGGSSGDEGDVTETTEPGDDSTAGGGGSSDEDDVTETTEPGSDPAESGNGSGRDPAATDNTALAAAEDVSPGSSSFTETISTEAVSNPEIDYNTKGHIFVLNKKNDKGAAFEKLAARFKEASGIDISVTTPGASQYSTTLRDSLSGKSDTPTLFMLSGRTDYEKYSSYCLDLSGLPAVQELTDEKFLLRGSDGKIYGIPFIVETYGLTVNTHLLAKAGYELSDIQSFDDLRRVAEDITSRKKELGFSAFTSPTLGKDSSGTYRFGEHAPAVPLYYEMKDNGFKIGAELHGTYLDCFKSYIDLYLDNSVVPRQEAATRTLKESRKDFLTEKAVFHQDGSWGADEIRTALRDQAAVIPLYMGIPGEQSQGVNENWSYFWCINKNASSDDIEAASQFLEWLVTSKEGNDIITFDMGFQMPYIKASAPENLYLQTLRDQEQEGKEIVTQYYKYGKYSSWTNNLQVAIRKYADGSGSWKDVENAFVALW